MVVNNPKAYLKVFVYHWENSLPDLTDVPTFGADELSFWIRHHKKSKKKNRKVKKPHRLLPGVCAKWFNLGVDFAIQNNTWPVRMQVDEVEVDLTVRFIIVVWVYYTSNMYTRPALSSNACQKVLSYFLTNTTNIVRTWRHRMYSYSSGTILMEVKQPIVDWIEADEADAVNKEQALRRLDNSSNELYPLVSSLILYIQQIIFYLVSFSLCLLGRSPRLLYSLLAVNQHRFQGQCYLKRILCHIQRGSVA